MIRTKSRRNLDDIDFTDNLMNTLRLARASSRNSSKDSFRSVREKSVPEQYMWNNGDGGWEDVDGAVGGLDPGGGAIPKKRTGERHRSHSADGPRRDKTDNILKKFKNFSDNFKQYKEADRSRPRQRMTTQTRPTPAPRTDVHVVEDEDEQEERDEHCHGSCNQQYRQYRQTQDDVQFGRDLGDRYGDDGMYDTRRHTNKHRIVLPRFTAGPVNLKQVKNLTQAMGEKYSYIPGKRGAAEFIDNTVNMFKSQIMTADTFKFLIFSLLDSAAKKKVGKLDLHRLTPDAFIEKILRRLDDSSTLDELAREFYSKQPSGESVSDWFEILENSGTRAQVPKAAIWQRFLNQIPIAMALPLDRELRYQIRRFGRYPDDGPQYLLDILGEIVDSVKAYVPRPKQSQEPAPDKRYRPAGRGYVRLVDEQEAQVASDPYDPYMDEQVEEEEKHGTAGYRNSNYRQEGDHVRCHNCHSPARQVRQCNNITKRDGTCDSCGKIGHTEAECWKNEVCKKCNRPGHIAEVCRSKQTNKDKNGNGKIEKTPRKDCGRCGAMQHKSTECPMYTHDKTLKEPCQICQNYFQRNFWHAEDKCLVKRSLLRPMSGN